MPRISIVTPFYNTGMVFQDTILSIYNQTFSDWEWIIVDDGSCSKESLLQLDALRNNNDSRIKIIVTPANKGLPSARNTGIKAAGANFIFFIDSDDLIDASTLEKLYLILLANSEFHFANSYVKGFGSQHYKWTGGFHEGMLFLKENRNTSCFMARREVFEQVLFDETMRHGCEDWEFWIHSASKKIWGHTIPEFLMYNRKVHGPGWNKPTNQQSLSSLREKIEKHYAPAIKKNGFPAPSFENYQFGNIGNLLPVPGEKAQTAYTILCIFPWLKIGGADKFNLDLLKGLKQKGWKIFILTTLGTDHPWQEYFEEVTKEIFHLCNLAPDHKHYLFIDYFIKSRRPGTLFISNSMYGYQMLPYIKRRYPFLFVVDYSHCEEPGWYGGGYPFLSAVYSEFLDKSFVTSKHLQQWMEKKGAALAKTEVCYIGVETGSIIKNTGNRKKIRHQLNLTEAIPLILFVGRLTQQKQPAVLAKSLQLLNEKFNTFQAIIIGDGPDEELLKKIVKKYGLEKRVMFLGGQSNEIVLTYMDAADIFFLPSAYEGIALSIYESMAKALPVVAAHVGGQAELVQPDCGYLIKRSTPDQEALEYSACLEYLCRNPDKSKLMGTVGRKRVENFFSLQSAINQFEAGIEKSSFLEKESTVSFGESRDYLVTINHLRYLELQAQIPTTGMRLLEKLKVLNPLIFRLYGILKRFKR